ncbi:Ankyrin repeat, SAM and basic leucine zipper domain-containing protein 1, partial [Eufriesea mexicana]
LDGYTPLMALCNSLEGTTEQRLKCLKILIKAGANVNATNKRRQTPLMFACILQEPKFALMYATIANKPEIVKILIENAADITLTDFNNLTVNNIASEKGYDEILSLLNCNEEKIVDTYEISKMNNWKDMYPSLTNISNQTIDFDIFSILYGMNLEEYINIFQGMNLKTFLMLTENDLCHLGMDINAHRIQFLEHLHLFHRKNWSIQSIGAITDSYTLYDGILTLGVITKQIAIIGSSFQYITNNLLKLNNENVHLTEEQISNYEEKLKNTQGTLNILEKELIQVKALSKKIQKENDIGIPATYIGPEKRKINWPMFLSITLIVGICMSKTIC